MQFEDSSHSFYHCRLFVLQVMSTSEKFRALIRLALADNKFETSEKKFIQALAKRLEVSNDELNKMLREERSREDYSPVVDNLSYESSVKFLVVLVSLMKIDGEVYLSEIKFCEKMADKLGFSRNAIGYLSDKIDSNPRVTPDWNSLNYNMKKYVG